MSVDGNDDLAVTEAGGVLTIGTDGEGQNEDIARLHEEDEAEELGGADGEGAYATNEFIELDDDDSDDYDD